MLLGGHRTQNHTFGDGGLDALWAVSLDKSSVSKVTPQPGSGDFPDAFGLGGPDSTVPGILSFDFVRASDLWVTVASYITRRKERLHLISAFSLRLLLLFAEAPKPH